MKFKILYVGLMLNCFCTRAQLLTPPNGVDYYNGRLHLSALNIGGAYNDTRRNINVNGSMLLGANYTESGDIHMDGKADIPLATRLGEKMNNSLQAVYAGDFMMSSYCGIAMNLGTGLADRNNGRYNVLPNTSSFTINTFTSATTLKTLFTVRDNGNVGMGTTIPRGKLDVIGSLHLGSIDSSGDITFEGARNVPLATRLTNRGNSSLQVVNGGDVLLNNYWGVAININGGLLGDGNPNSQNAVVPNTASFTINSFTNENTLNTLFTIRNNGNVGIGTKNPSEMLSVSGTVLAKKVKVTTSGWADYVFDEDYKLPSLKETAAYIKANKHLPEIPSAAEVVEDGQDVGEMNKLLLKKVEELTLHLIELQAKVEKLEAAQK